MKVNISQLCSLLQTIGHEGYAMHELEVHTICNGCESTVVIKEPMFDVEVLSDKTARLIITNNEECKCNDVK